MAKRPELYTSILTGVFIFVLAELLGTDYYSVNSYLLVAVYAGLSAALAQFIVNRSMKK